MPTSCINASACPVCAIARMSETHGVTSTGSVRRVNHHPDREGTVEGGLVTPKKIGIGEDQLEMLHSSGKKSRSFALSWSERHSPAAPRGYGLDEGNPGSAARSARGDPKRFPPALQSRAPSTPYEPGNRSPELLKTTSKE
jgi:hypothetical protein